MMKKVILRVLLSIWPLILWKDDLSHILYWSVIASAYYDLTHYVVSLTVLGEHPFALLLTASCALTSPALRHHFLTICVASSVFVKSTVLLVVICMLKYLVKTTFSSPMWCTVHVASRHTHTSCQTIKDHYYYRERYFVSYSWSSNCSLPLILEWAHQSDSYNHNLIICSQRKVTLHNQTHKAGSVYEISHRIKFKTAIYSLAVVETVCCNLLNDNLN